MKRRIEWWNTLPKEEKLSMVKRPAGQERDVLNGETSLSTTKYVEE